MKSITGRSKSGIGALMRYVGIPIAGILAILLGACGIEKPQAPSWDTDIVLPLISHHYDMIELIDRIADDGLSYDSLGNLSFSVEQNIDTFAVDAALTVSDLADGFHETLGLIELANPDAISEIIYLQDHLTLAGDVPAMAIDTSQYFPTIPDIRRATIESGTMLVTATNNLDLPLDTLIVTIAESAQATAIGTAIFESGLDIGETESIPIDLSGKTISGSFVYSAHLHTPGGTVLAVAEKNVELGAAFPDVITVSSATAVIPSQERQYSRDFSFPDDNRITAANIANGVLELNLANETNLSSSITVTIQELTLGGEPLSFDIELPPQDNSITTLDLEGYELRPLAGVPQPTIRVSMDVNLPGSGSDAVEISSTDGVSIDMNVSNLEFSSVAGAFAPTVIEIEPVTKAVDVPGAFEGFNLTSAVLTVELYCAADVPGEVYVLLESDVGRQVEISGDITRGTVRNPGFTSIVVEELGDILNPVPSQITASGFATVGDGVTPGAVTDNDFVCGRITITSPLEMTVSGVEFKADINEAQLDSEIEDIADDLNHGSVHAQITNHLPLGASLVLYLDGNSANLYESHCLTIGPIEIGSAVVGSNGLVSEPVVSNVEVSLSHEDLAILENETLYIGQVITLDGSGDQTVRIVSTDYIDVQAYMTVNARVDVD